jgi:hypothetical protein
MRSHRCNESDRDDGCESTFTDMSTIIFRVSRGQGSGNKSVELYTGCLGAAIPTERITALIKTIDRFAGTGALLERREQARRPDGGAAKP